MKPPPTAQPPAPPPAGMVIYTAPGQARPFPGVGEMLLPLGDRMHLLLPFPQETKPS